MLVLESAGPNPKAVAAFLKEKLGLTSKQAITLARETPLVVAKTPDFHRYVLLEFETALQGLGGATRVEKLPFENPDAD